MDWKTLIEDTKADIKRSFSFKLERTYFMRICIVFALNIIGMAGFVILKEKFPIFIFVALWAISFIVIGNICWQISVKDLKNNLPDIFEIECQKYGVAKHDFKCRIIYIGTMFFRGFSCRIYVYDDAVLLKFWKQCAVINDGKQIKITKAVFGYRVEFEKDGCYVQCHANQKQADILQQWINGNS